MKVSYVSACFDSSGYAEAARNNIGALDALGVEVNVVPVSFEPFSSVDAFGPLGNKVQSLINTSGSAGIQILHLTPDNYHKYVLENKYNIGYAAWETSRLPESWVESINTLNEVWVPSEYNRKVFVDSGVTVPVSVMPHAFNNNEYADIEYKNVIPKSYESHFKFYSVFQWTERKNPLGLLKAFLTEFDGSCDAVLVLKTYMRDPTDPEDNIAIKREIQNLKQQLRLANYPRILLITSLLSRAQIRSLHKECNCYVSLHRSEGFGVPLAEAMFAGNPTISTNYSGNVDFSNLGTVPINHTLTPVCGMPWDNYRGDTEWAEPDLSQAKKQMRELYENRVYTTALGEEAKLGIQQSNSWKTIGQLMKDRLAYIEKEMR